ncbi:DUF4240 domain-containing protein [Micromonospora musae]|uniref:DUF4240 domain-containing protein n=1 Tax=Micromonospora musae TaxID=1894970 RepID=UPI0033E76970
MGVDVNELWCIVERVRAAVGPAADRARKDGRPSVVAEELVAELCKLSLPEIVAFDQLFDDVRDQVDNWDTCAACWVVEHGFLSDDGFSDFGAGLVGLGRSAFEAAVTEPDSLQGNWASSSSSASWTYSRPRPSGSVTRTA